MKKIDLVYVLGTGSNWNNNEIRFSIRSVHQYLEGFGKIFIVGEKPDFLEGCIHIQHPDEFSPENADGNIIRKVLRACQDPRVSEKFLFMNDDHLFLKETRVAEIPPFHKGDMNSFPQHFYGMNPWRKRLYLTKLALEKQGLPTLHYDCHTPVIFEKKKFIEAMSRFDYASGVGLTMKSLYGNIYYPKAPLLAGEKRTLFSFYKIQQLEAMLQHAFLLAFNDQGLNDSLKVFLYQKFREPSPLETIPIQDKIIDICIAAREPVSYQMVMDTYIKYFKNSNIQGMLSIDRNSRFENKIRYLLEKQLADL